MKHFLPLIAILLLIVVIPVRQMGQSAKLQRLQTQLDGLEDGHKKVQVLHELAELLQQDQADLAREYAVDAYRLSKKLKYTQGVKDNAYLVAYIDKEKGRYKRALPAGEEGARRREVGPTETQSRKLKEPCSDTPSRALFVLAAAADATQSSQSS